MVYRAADPERQLLQRSGARRRQPAVGRGAQPVARAGAASTSSSSAPTCSGRSSPASARSRPLEVRRLDGSLAERTVFGGPHRAGGRGLGVRRVRAGPLARRLAADARARPSAWIATPSSKRVNWSPRAGVAIGVRRKGARSCAAASASSSSGRRSTSRRFPSFESRDGLAVRAGRHAARSPPIAFANVLDADSAHAGSLCRQRRVEPALRPAPAVQAGVPAAPGLARVHPHARPRRERAAAVEHRHVTLPGARGDDAVSGRRAAGPDRLVRLGAGAPPISTTTISSSATCATRSSAPTRTT